MKNDLISKQAVEEIIIKYRDEQADKLEEIALERAYGANKVGMLISELPTVKPIKGEWIDTGVDGEFQCSHCKGLWQDAEENTYEDWKQAANFCPNCGADMRGSKE